MRAHKIMAAIEQASSSSERRRLEAQLAAEPQYIGVNPAKVVTVSDLIALAYGLKGDESSEYNRALVELISDVVYSAGDDRTYADVAALVGVPTRR